MKARLIVIVVALLAIAACKRSNTNLRNITTFSRFVETTPNEDSGIREVAGFYNDGILAYAKGSTDGKRYFRIAISGTSHINKYANDLELIGSNIAYTFYKRLKAEVKDYDYIVVAIKNRGKTVQIYSYDMKLMATVKQKMDILKNVVRLMAVNDFDSLNHSFDSSFSATTKEELLHTLDEIQPKFGTINGFMPIAFRVYHRDYDGWLILHLSGAVLRSKENHVLSIEVYPYPNRDKLLSMSYGL